MLGSRIITTLSSFFAALESESDGESDEKNDRNINPFNPNGPFLHLRENVRKTKAF